MTPPSALPRRPPRRRPAMDLRAAWPHLRAALVTLHCAAIALVAIPSPSPSVHVLRVNEPGFATEVHPWAQLFGVSDVAFADGAERARARWVETRARWLAPLERYLAWVGAPQAWSMFSSPNRSPSHFVVEVRSASDAEDDWHYLSGLPAGPWRRSFFESERVRSLVNVAGRAHDARLADDLCFHVARLALREHGDWDKARCRLVSTPSPSWRTPERGALRVAWSRVVDRDR